MGQASCCTAANVLAIADEPEALAKWHRNISLRNKTPPKLLLISDPGQDLDDEMTFIMLRYLADNNLVCVEGIVTTLAPAFDRARLTQGTLATLGLHGVPIGQGSDGGDLEGTHKASTFENWAKPYMPPRHSSIFEPGQGLLHRKYTEAAPKSLTLVIIASLKDPALFLRDEEELFKAKTREVVIMGGVEPWEEKTTRPVVLKPDTAHNQMFDKAASDFFYRRCQELGVSMTVVSRWAAYAAKVPRSCYDELAALGSWVGCRLRNAQRSSIEGLWNRACGSGKEREGLPDRCDRSWFLKTFCDGHAAPGRGRGDTIWDLIAGFMQYDTIATLAAIPVLRAELFRPAFVPALVSGVSNSVIGVTEQNSGIVSPDSLAKYLKTGFVRGLAANHHRRVQFILLSQPRWNNRCEELLACTVLRAVFELGILDCAGIVISPGPSDGQEEGDDMTLKESADELVTALKILGLAHVPVHVAECYTAKEGKTSGVEILEQLYKKVSPAGVSLLVTGALGEVADFAETCPTEFQQKTQQVILMGGAFPSPELTPEGFPNGNVSLSPDPGAQNNKLDMQSATRFHRKAQELLVPLIVISRHSASALQVPRALFDNLASHGGAMGKKLQAVQHNCIVKLWKAATAPEARDRRGLPMRCDKDWFVSTFCGGTEPDLSKGDAGIWEVVKSFNVYSLLAVLVSLPPFFNKYISGTATTVRSVRHQIIGLTREDHGVIDLDATREIIFQCLFRGAILNESNFNLSKPPDIVMSSGKSWTYKSDKKCLDWMLPAPLGKEDMWQLTEDRI